MKPRLVFPELQKFIKPYNSFVKFSGLDRILDSRYLTDKNKTIICYDIGDLYNFKNLIPFLESAEQNKVFYVFLTASEPPLFLNQYQNYIKFYFIPSFYHWWAQYMPKTDTEKNIKKHFLSTNNRQDFARLSLFFYFIKNNLLEKSYFSYIGEERPVTFDQCIDSKADFYLNEFDCQDTKKIKLSSVKNLIPYYLDNDPIKGVDWSLALKKYYNESFLSIVVETYCGDNPPFFTEKIWKPIAMKQPFILINSKHSLKFLRDLGFKTFNGIIDETYDTLDNPDRFETTLREIKRISNFSIPELNRMHQELENVLEHNYNHFYDVLPKIYNVEIEKIGKDIDKDIQKHIQYIQ